jgi:transcriptional regulator with XRE-family HTH domain
MILLASNQQHDNKIKALAINLTNLLKNKGINESDLAKRLNLPYNTIHRIITGTTSDPRLSTLKQLADYFDVTIDTLINQDHHAPTSKQAHYPEFTPLISWNTLNNLDFNEQGKIILPEETSWIRTPAIEGIHKQSQLFALESTKSMQSRFPPGTTFIINSDEKPMDGDMILVKFKLNHAVSLRELITDPPRWQLLPITPGSESMYFDEGAHVILGVVMLTLIKTRLD